jgi:hypothetical protein
VTTRKFSELRDKLYERSPDSRARVARNQAQLTAARGRGRPPVGERIEVRLPADVVARIDRLAEEFEQTRAETLRAIIIEGVP